MKRLAKDIILLFRLLLKRLFSGIFGQIDARDVIAVIGLLLLSAGFYQIYWPAALIVPGGILCWYAFVLLRQSSSDRNGPTE